MTDFVLPTNGAEHGRMRLFCFAHAGGSAEFFRQWQPLLAPDIVVCPIELPGRGRRFGEPFSESLVTAAVEAAEKAAPLARLGEYALFGHSLGSIMALETARALEEMTVPSGRCVFVSGRVAPHVACRDAALHMGADEELVREVRRLGGTPEDVLSDGQFLEYLLPIVRNDFRLLETYEPRVSPKIHSPVHVCSGDSDPDASAELLPRWEDITDRP